MLKKRKLFYLKIMNKAKKGYKSAVVALMTIILMSNKAFANPPKIVTGTQNLFIDASNWLLILIPSGAGLALGWFAFKKSMTEDDGLIGDYNRKMKKTVISAIIAESAMGIVRLVLGYYA